ncbi:S-layer homology domain-containing protein [Paenibacillus filicis]|uniref:S-layer homology domain-containing protein n=1 Tax=Paenibacillus gyeongsangnamensis TaxID=3388067 RepID=A0ABT4QHW9_9BACL|nr:S-layer homology domain-containing protein [Paenibacillus filicis]MCZ8516440.1 S-layer homology domain-containing protein [Paenibacillus filicis]
MRALDFHIKKYNDGGNNAGDPNSSLGNIVSLVNTLRGNYSSTNPAKKYFSYPRPFRWSSTSIVVPSLVPAISTDPATDGGFPSGHTNAAFLSAIAMAYAIPERYQELLTRASELGNNRIVAGMHSPLDVMGGRVMATALAAAILSDPNNTILKQAAYDDAHSKLLTQTSTAADRFSDYAKNKQEYTGRLTYGFSQINSTTNPMAVPKGAEVLLETRLPYLDSTERRWVLATTGLPSGYPVLDDAEGWGRLNLFAAADGYGAFASDVTVTMDAYKGGFNALDRWRNDISGIGKLTKEGTGTLKLQGNNTYSGGTQIDGGTLEGNSETAFGSGDVANNGGTLIKNVSGKMTIGGNYTQAAGGTLELKLSSNHDLLEIKGVVKPDGKLRLNFSNNYVPDNGVVTIITHGKDQRNGQFSSVDAVGLPSQYKVKVIYNSDSIQLAVDTAAPSGSSGYTGISLDSSNYSWAIKAIDALASKGIIQGTSDKTFSPGTKISRADMVVLLVRALNLKAEFTSNFSDVNKSDYYYESLGIAKQLGLVNGMEENIFDPKKEITREDLMVLCVRALKLSGNYAQGNVADLSKFADSTKIAPYAVEGVASLVKLGIVEGSDNGINPLGTATRAEAAVIIYRMMNMK